MKKFFRRIVQFLIRIVYGFTVRPVYSVNETRLQPNTSTLLNIREEGEPKAQMQYARYTIFLPRREASGLLFHTGVGDAAIVQRVPTIKVANTSATKVVRVPKDTHIGFLFYIY